MIQSINSNASYYTSAIRQNNTSANVSKNTSQTGMSFSLNGLNDDSSDDSSSGIVTSFEELMKMMQGHRMPPPPESMDTSSDSTSITQASSGLTSSTGTTESSGITDTFDTDGDGSISADEYENLISQLGMTDAPDSESIFKQFDTDSDGEITLDEIKSGKESLATEYASQYSRLAGNTINAYEMNYNFMYQNGLSDISNAV